MTGPIRPRRWTRPLPLLAVLALWGTIFTWFGIGPGQLLSFTAYLGWAVLLPGVLVYRSLRRTRHGLVDDVVVGGVVGLALELGAYCLFAGAGQQRLLVLWPLLVVVPFLVVGRLRRHWWVTGGRPAPIGWSWAVAGIVSFYSLYVTAVHLRAQPPFVTAGSRWYVFDLQGLMALAAEAKHHFPLQVPMVAGEPLSYHWFAPAHEATASLISGVDLPVVYHGFEPILMAGAAVVSLALVGWRVSGRPWVGVVAAALTFVVGELTIGSSSSWLGSSTTFVWASTTTVFSWSLLFVLVMVVADRIMDAGLPDAPIGRGAWILVALLSMASAGAKSTGLPAIVSGVLLAAVVHAVRTRRVRELSRFVAVLGLAAAAFCVAMVAVYRGGGSSGLTIAPLTALGIATINARSGSRWHEVFTYLVAIGGYAIYELPRLAGVPVLAWLARRGRARWGTLEWFLLGGITSGVLATLLFGHPSGSELYFIRSAWGMGAILSAMGFVRLVEDRKVAPRTMAILLAGSAVAVLGPYVVAYRGLGGMNVAGLRHMMPMYVAAALIAGVLLIGALCWPLVRRRWPGTRGIGAVAAVTLVLSAGLPNFVADERVISPWHSLRSYHEQVTPTMIRAGHWIRDHSAPDELVATNQHSANVPNGYSLSFWINDYAERRTLVGSWLYFTRSIQTAAQADTSFRTVPFWDQELLRRNDEAFSAPTPESIGWLREERGVRWMVVNRDVTGPESARLASLAELEFQEGPIAVYHLR